MSFDVLPVRASKGHAVRYVAYRWGLPLERFLVAGDSGNDECMLRGTTLGAVGNYSRELEPLRERAHVYFARRAHAAGILEGIETYGFARRELPEPPSLPATELALGAVG